MPDLNEQLRAERAAEDAEKKPKAKAKGKAGGRPGKVPRRKGGGGKSPAAYLRAWYQRGTLGRLSAGARSLYPILLMLADLKRGCYSKGGLPRMAQSCGGVHVSTVARWLKELEAAGMVVRRQLKGHRAGQFFSGLMVWLKLPAKSADGSLDGMGGAPQE